MTTLEFSSEAFEGLSSREKLVYAALHEEHPATVNSLAERLGCTTGNVRDALHRLEESDLATKKPDRRIHANAMAWGPSGPQL